MSNKRHEGFDVFRIIYLAGVIGAVVVLLNQFGVRPSRRDGTAGLALFFILWGGLMLASAHLALKKGREFVEGLVLGAFGPLGFIIEVLLPAAKTVGSAHPVEVPAKAP